MELEKELELLRKENEELKDQIRNLSEIDLTFIPKNGRVKTIRWGDDYFKWDLEKRAEYAEALAAAMNEAADKFQTERNELLKIVEKLEKSLVNAETAYHGQKDINILSITAANEERQQLAEALASAQNQLRAKTKEADMLRQELTKLQN